MTNNSREQAAREWVKGQLDAGVWMAGQGLEESTYVQPYLAAFLAGCEHEAKRWERLLKPLTIEEAEKAYNESPSMPLSEELREQIVRGILAEPNPPKEESE